MLTTNKKETEKIAIESRQQYDRSKHAHTQRERDTQTLSFM